MAGAALLAVVRALYEAHPYPHYPLLARPRWQDGFLTHSRFAAALTADVTRAAPAAWRDDRGADAGAAPRPTVLIGGGGEILPYIVRRWEAYGRPVVSVDLSANSSRRAKLRLATCGRYVRFFQGDVGAFLAAGQAQAYAHIDTYGVLHHLADPSQTLHSMARALAPGGTARVMVYNSPARAWIWQLQRLFALLGFDPLAAADLEAARRLLADLADASPALAARLAQLGRATLANRARFADTFLHPREARLSIDAWYAAIHSAGFTVGGLYDRYAELDDLPNPLWQAPAPEQLTPRALDRRFENNLELYLVKDGGAASRGRPPRGSTLRYRLKAPPSSWFTYQETDAVPRVARLRLWYAHLAWVINRDNAGMPALLSSLPRPAVQRLTRIGAILPGQIADHGLRAALASPMAASMDAPAVVAATALPESAKQRVVDLLAARGKHGDGYIKAALERIARAARA